MFVGFMRSRMRYLECVRLQLFLNLFLSFQAVHSLPSGVPLTRAVPHTSESCSYSRWSTFLNQSFDEGCNLGITCGMALVVVRCDRSAVLIGQIPIKVVVFGGGDDGSTWAAVWSDAVGWRHNAWRCGGSAGRVASGELSAGAGCGRSGTDVCLPEHCIHTNCSGSLD